MAIATSTEAARELGFGDLVRWSTAGASSASSMIARTVGEL